MVGLITLILMILCILFAFFLLYKTRYSKSTSKIVTNSLKLFIFMSIGMFLITGYYVVHESDNNSCGREIYRLGSGSTAYDDPIINNRYGFIVDFNISSLNCDNALYYELCFSYNNTGGDNILRVLNGNNLEANFIYLDDGVGESCYKFTRNERNSDDYCHSTVGVYCEDCTPSNPISFSEYTSEVQQKRVAYNSSFRTYSVSNDYPLDWSLTSFNSCNRNIVWMLGAYMILIVLFGMIIGIIFLREKFENEIDNMDDYF